MTTTISRSAPITLDADTAVTVHTVGGGRISGSLGREFDCRGIGYGGRHIRLAVPTYVGTTREVIITCDRVAQLEVGETDGV